ncbi:hypothetical protein K1719_016776 [Acacia pycnantha]|nr:hypothetical protein K1719_016776 [Acacia pycnantha]
MIAVKKEETLRVFIPISIYKWKRTCKKTLIKSQQYVVLEPHGDGIAFVGGDDNGSGIDVAVKKISNESQQGIIEFVAEIVSIGHFHHRNLVPLLGYCR